MESTAYVDPVELGDLPAMAAGVDAVLAERAVLAAAEARLIRRHAALAEIALAQTERIASKASRERDMPMRSLSAEVAIAANQNDRTVQRELSEAWSLVTHLPATVDALEAARISMRHVAVIHEIGVRLAEPDVRAAWESVVLDYAATTTPARTKAFALQLAEKVDPVPMQERFDAAHATRDVSIIDLDDGMALLQVRLAATLAYGIRDRIRRQARLIHRAAEAERARRAAADEVPAAPTDAAASLLDGDEAPEPIDDRRTQTQIQADLVADMLLTGAPAVDPTGELTPGGLGAIRPHVQIVVPVTTLTGTTRGGALLNGQIPVDPETARRLAGNAPGWDRVMCDPVTGTVQATDRYTPRQDQIRFLRARDQHCRAFGCRQPVARCQIDHNHEWHEGGTTHLGNLAHLCVRHHTLKTETAWTVTQGPGGMLHFTSPLGREYRDAPPPRVMFHPDPPPPF